MEAKKIIDEELERLGEEKVRSLEERNSNQVVAYCSADAYFMKNGFYKYDYSKIGEAHDSCLKKYVKALSSSTNRVIIVDNTHTKSWEYSPYTALARVYGCEVYIIEVYRFHTAAAI